MHIHDLAKAYQAKTDEELLELAADSQHLTTEACAILTGELARRRIDKTKRLTDQDASDRGRIEQPTTLAISTLPDSEAVGEFVAEVLRIYHGHFWLFVKLIAPAVVVGYVAVIMGRNEGREIARHLPRGVEALQHKTEVFEIWFANSAGFIISWMAFCFSFGAICSAVGQIEAGVAPSIPDSLAAVRERMGSFLRSNCCGAGFCGSFLGVESASPSSEPFRNASHPVRIRARSPTAPLPVCARDTRHDFGQL
jgi:hypothetical protein